MRCPYCRHPDSRVVDSREQDEGQVIRRRRSCQQCGRRFTTVEEATLAVIKRSGVTEPFSREQGGQRGTPGLSRPAGRRGCAGAARADRRRRVRATGVAEVPSDEVGLAILGPLRELDEVAYLRFASVYKSFSSIDDFEKAITELRNDHRKNPPSRERENTDDRGRRDGCPRTAAAGARATLSGGRVAGRRLYTTAGVHPYDEVSWERRDVVMTNWRDGSINFEQRGVEFPDFWSVNAANIVTTKYFRGAVGTDAREWSLRQLIDRVVKKYRRGRGAHGYFGSAEDAELFEHELTWMLLHQVFSFNSPVWFNVGTSQPQQVSACQPYDALVSTPAGLVPIGKLVEDDAVGAKVYDAHGVTKVLRHQAQRRQGSSAHRHQGRPHTGRHRRPPRVAHLGRGHRAVRPGRAARGRRSA